MKKFILGLVIGILLGIFIGGLFWSKEYVSLYKKYYRTREAIQLLK